MDTELLRPLDLSSGLEFVPQQPFKPTDDQVRAFVTHAKMASKIFLEINIEKWDEISPQTKDKLNSAAESLTNFGQLGIGLSQLAHMTGGHARTWQGIAAASQSAISLSQGITAIANSSSLISLSAITGYVGIAVAGIGLAMNLFGGDDNNIAEGLNVIIQELAEIKNAIYEIHRDLIEIGRRLEEILIVCILTELNQINSKLNRLERIVTHSFKELHSKELIDIIDTIKKEICGEHQLTSSEKRDYMRRLTTWIDHHSKSQLQTFLVRGDGDKRKMVEILESSDFDIYAMLPLFVNMLSSIMPLEIDITNVPNIRVFSAACEVYMLAVRHGYGSNSGITERIIDTYDGISTVVKSLCDKTKIDVVDILHRQYDYYRFHAGFAIAKCRLEYLKNNKDETLPLGQCLITGELTEMLLSLLNEMELRRLLLVKFNELVRCDNMLESRKEILCMPLQNYKPDPNLKQYSKGSKVKEFKRALEMGSDPNIWDSWGMPIHYITKHCNEATGVYHNHENITLHIMFRCPNIIMAGATQCDQGDTWGTGANPILHVMNSSRYKMAILFCANGFDIADSDGRGVPHGFYHFNNSHCGNLYWWCEDEKNVNSLITRDFMKAMNGNGVLNKAALRKAYGFYKMCEAGFIDNLEPDVSQECLLLLTCILGDLLPFKTLTKDKPTFDVNALIPGVGISYLMVASDSDQVDVIRYLQSLGADLRVKSTLKAWANEDNHCLKMATVSKADLAVNHLSNGNEKALVEARNNQRIQFPIYAIGKTPVNDHKPITNDIFKLINDRIDSIRNTPANNEPDRFKDTIDNCKLFQELINTYRTEHAVFKVLDKAMQHVTPRSTDLLSLISAFNNVDALLRIRRPDYKLGSKIDLLIEEIKTLL